MAILVTPRTDRIPEWSKMQDEEIINQVFDGKIITSLDHEALIRNVGARYNGRHTQKIKAVVAVV